MSSTLAVFSSQRLVLALMLVASAVLLSPLAIPQAHAAGASITGGAMRPGFNQTALAANDDGSTGLVPLNFTVNFFGTNYTSLYVNNNGDLTFDSALVTFTPFPLTTTQRVIIAPYFADVDTRVGNLLRYGNGTVNGHPAFGATWPGVGCYNQINIVKDYFQVVLIYRPDIAPGDFDIEFNYNSIQWESGTASGGNSLCLAGSSARVGFSAGTGASGTFFELAGSGVNGAFLDSNNQTGLIHNSLNSAQLGRYLFAVRAGTPVIVPIVVTCSGPVTVGVSSTCAVTVTDTSAAPTTPAGTVSFMSDSPGSFTGSPCTLAGSGSSATCHAEYTPSAVGSGTHTITATYSGDVSHSASSEQGTLTVTGLAFDFNLLAPSPASLTVVQGGSSPSASIEATLTGGSTAPVTFSASGLPSGVTATFANNPCSPTCTVTVSFSASATATLGTVIVSIDASGDGASHSTSLSLTIVSPTPAFDFILSTPSPNSLTVVQGSTSASSSIDASLVTGTTAQVTFSASDLPSGITAIFTNNSCSPACTVTVSFSATATATLGTATVSIDASGGGAAHSTSLSLTVVAPVPHVTTTTVTCSSPVFVGSPSTCTTNVMDNDASPTTPGVTVSFTSDGPGSFTGSPCTLQGSGPSASCQVYYTPSAVGTALHVITGTYSGDSAHSASHGSGTVGVFAIIGVSRFGCLPNPESVNQPSTCTFFISDTSGNPTSAQGTVSFSTDSPGSFTPAAGCTLSQGSGPPGTAICQVTYTPSVVGSGVHTITATYSGDSTHAGEVSTFGLTVVPVATGQIDLTFQAFDCDDWDNGVGELNVLVNNQLVVDIPAGINHLTGTGDYALYDNTWVSFGPFNIASMVSQGTNTLVFRNPLTSHGCKIRQVLIVQGTTVLLNQPRVRFISPNHTVTFTFSNPPLTMTSFTASPNPVVEFSQTSLTATYTGGVGPFTCRFRFGDGQTATVTSTTNTCSVTHIYLDDKIYNATIRVIGVNTSDLIAGSMPVQVLEDHPLIAVTLANSIALSIPQLPSTIVGNTDSQRDSRGLR